MCHGFQNHTSNSHRSYTKRGSDIATMKIRNGHGKYTQRRAISPIIATVLIIAVTLIAAVAIGGFVFGIFGSASSSAQVQVTSQNLIAADLLSTNTAASPTCNVAGAADDLTLTNTGTAATSVTGVTITWAGAVNSFATSGVCIVAAAGNAGATTNGNPISILFGASNALTVSATTGQTYTGTVTLGNGAVLLFTGTFN
jgi:flagellin-like protein